MLQHKGKIMWLVSVNMVTYLFILFFFISRKVIFTLILLHIYFVFINNE